MRSSDRIFLQDHATAAARRRGGYSRGSRRPRELLSLAVAVMVLFVVVAPPAEAAGPKITVRGNQVFGAGEIRSIYLGGGGPKGPAGAGLSAVLEAYYREGYLLAAVNVSREAEDSSFVLTINEGNVARIGRVTVSGTKARGREAIGEALGLKTGEDFRPRLLERRMNDLLEAYDEWGYGFAQIWIDSLQLEEEKNLVHVAVFVVEGEQKDLQGVVVEGLKKTRPDLAVRLSGLKTGRPYRAEMLRDAYLRLTSAGVFEDVEYPKLRVSANGRGVDAVLVLQESKTTNSFSSALGYATAEGGGDREISGLAQLKLNNIGGSLKDLGLFWSNDGKARTDTRLKYRDRFFLGRRLGVGLYVEQTGLDTLYSRQSFGTDVDVPVGRWGGGLVGLSGGVFADRSVFSVGEIRRSWRLRVAAGFSLAGGARRATRFQTMTRFTAARKTTYPRPAGDTETLLQYVVEFEGQADVTIRPVLHLGFELVYRGLESDEPVIPLSERFYVGGARTLRGYKENQFNGRRVATTRTELRFGRAASENVYLFTDTGYVLRQNADVTGVVLTDDLFKVGYGFGLRTGSRLGSVDLSFGVGEKPSLRQTKVHVILEQNF